MLPTTIPPISGHHYSGSISQSQDHQRALGPPNNNYHQLEGPEPHFDTRGRPVPGVCFLSITQTFVVLIDRAHNAFIYI